MGKHRRTSTAITQARINSAGRVAGSAHAISPARTASGILALALVVGGVGTEAAVASSHGTNDQANAQHKAGGRHAAATVELTATAHAAANPWMF